MENDAFCCRSLNMFAQCLSVNYVYRYFYGGFYSPLSYFTFILDEKAAKFNWISFVTLKSIHIIVTIDHFSESD